VKKRPFTLIPALAAAVLAATVLYSMRCADSANTAADGPSAAAPGTLELYFFGSNTCGECLEIKHTLLFPLEQEMADKLKIHYHDIEDAASIELMIRLERQYGVSSPSPQELFFPDTFLLGYSSIMANGRAIVEEYLNDPQRRMAITVSEPAGNLDDALRERFETFTLLGIIAAALGDSVNPCAIATLVFLVSFLATQKRKRSEILVVGLAYSASVFITYFLLGLGVLNVLKLIESQQLHTVSCVISWSAVALAGIVGIISFIDAFRFKKSGNAKDVTLQLPKSVKLRIHKIITTNMKGSRLIIGTVITGFLVTLLEAACTGQVYLPTIIAMTRFASGDMKLTGWLYLLLYNFIFIVPLLAVMIAVYYGMTWNKLSKMMQNNLTLLKILLGTVMVGLATGLALYLAFFGSCGNDRRVPRDNVEQTIKNDAEQPYPAEDTAGDGR
jgi:hypothetical protein